MGQAAQGRAGKGDGACGGRDYGSCGADPNQRLNRRLRTERHRQRPVSALARLCCQRAAEAHLQSDTGLSPQIARTFARISHLACCPPGHPCKWRPRVHRRACYCTFGPKSETIFLYKPCGWLWRRELAARNRFSWNADMVCVRFGSLEYASSSMQRPQVPVNDADRAWMARQSAVPRAVPCRLPSGQRCR